MEYILIAIVLAAVFAFIAYPILYPSRTEPKKSSALDTLIAQRDSTYQAIRDLDFDYQLGKLSTSDYATLRERYKAHAAMTLHQIDAMGQTEAERVPQTRGQEMRCGNCGAPYEMDDKFCRKCGNRLR